MIYEFLTAKGVLSLAHKKELVEKRGFTEDMIAAHRFFSGGRYLLAHEKEFLSSFNEEALLSSGVFIKPERSQQMTLSPQLLDERIIIPYLNKDGKAYFIRPHKMGLEAPIQIYHEKAITSPSSFAILTESEFKAVAGTAWGYKTIGIPGIGSFADMHFKKFIEFVHKAGIKQICIIYDNEIKGDPLYPNYKEDPFKRYDTEYFAYIMAKNLADEGIDVHIGKLPDSWRLNGKIDLDGALAQKRTVEDIKNVIAEAKGYKNYIKDLPQEAQNILNRKVAKKYHRTHVSVDWGKYVANRRAGKQEWQEIISNFTLKVIARHETPEGVIREVILVDEFGKHSKSFALPSEPMVKRDSFANFVMNKGNYIWRGNNEDLTHIWQGLFFEDDGRHIIEPDHVGWVPDEKLFLFGNLAITDAGDEIRPDKNSIFWREKYGIKPIPISISSGKSAISEGMPILSTGPIDMEDIRKRLCETIGKYEAYVLLGWISSIPFLEDAFHTYNCFPFLFVTGRRGSGKSTIAEWAMNFFGIEAGGKMASDTTPVAIQRYLGYYSSLPVFIDEYRNTKNITVKNGFLRNVYNRQSAGKGIKSSFGVREGKIRGTLLVAGEETPDDNALLTRCVVINILDRKRVVNHFNWFQSHRSGLSNHLYNLLKKRKLILPQFIENLHQGKEFFVKKGLDDRMAINYSVIGSGYSAAFGSIPEDFQEYLATESTRVKDEYDKENAVGIFLEDLLAMQASRELNPQPWDFDAENIYLYFAGAYNAWSKQYRAVHGTEPFKASAIRKYLEEEPGFVQNDFNRRINGYPRHCIVFDRTKTSKIMLMLIGIVKIDK